MNGNIEFRSFPQLSYLQNIGDSSLRVVSQPDMPYLIVDQESFTAGNHQTERTIYTLTSFNEPKRFSPNSPVVNLGRLTVSDYRPITNEGIRPSDFRYYIDPTVSDSGWTIGDKLPGGELEVIHLRDGQTTLGVYEVTPDILSAFAIAIKIAQSSDRCRGDQVLQKWLNTITSLNTRPAKEDLTFLLQRQLDTVPVPRDMLINRARPSIKQTT